VYHHHFPISLDPVFENFDLENLEDQRNVEHDPYDNNKRQSQTLPAIYPKGAGEGNIMIWILESLFVHYETFL